MTRSIASTLVLLGVAGAAAFGHAHPFGDPRSGRGESTGSPLANAEIPAQAKAVLLSKCADCHSAETRRPVYARLAPGSWLIERDIMEARKHMDLSHWQELSVDQQEVLEAEIAQQAKLGRMPPLQYRLLHWNARLSPGDVEAFGHLRQSVETSSEAGTQGGDPVHGKLVFEKHCTGCHAMDRDREGPRLGNVLGRKAAAVPAFRYSDALKNAGFVWNESRLDRWLADPDRLVPNNAMSVDLPKASDRRDIIAFLSQETAGNAWHK